MDGRLSLAWSSRPQPLIARAAAAVGDAAVALGRRLAALDDEMLGRLTAVAHGGGAMSNATATDGAAREQLLIVLGDADALPWVDGVVYLGRDPAAIELLLPTASVPTVPIAVLQHAVLAKVRSGAPLALWSHGGVLRVVPCGAARAIERARLAAWLSSAEAAA